LALFAGVVVNAAPNRLLDIVASGKEPTSVKDFTPSNFQKNVVAESPRNPNPLKVLPAVNSFLEPTSPDNFILSNFPHSFMEDSTRNPNLFIRALDVSNPVSSFYPPMEGTKIQNRIRALEDQQIQIYRLLLAHKHLTNPWGGQTSSLIH